MVTRLKRFQKDPNGLGRGPGLYYLRGGKRKDSKNHTYTLPNGKIKTIKGPYYSKYSKDIDRNTKAKGFKQDPIGLPKKVANEYAHIGDGPLKDKILR